jgi:hypothetical protein
MDHRRGLRVWSQMMVNGLNWDSLVTNARIRAAVHMDPFDPMGSLEFFSRHPLP